VALLLGFGSPGTARTRPTSISRWRYRRAMIDFFGRCADAAYR
jgi:hypothetical protein